MKGRRFYRRVIIIRRMLTGTLVFSFLLIIGLSFMRIDEHYMCQGVIRPASELSIYSPEDGVLGEVLVQEDQYVQKGQPVFRLDSFELEQRETMLAMQQKELEAQLNLEAKRVLKVAQTTLPEWLRFADIDSRRSAKVVDYRKQVLGMLDQLKDSGLISRIEHDKARLELEQAEADLERNKEKAESVSPEYIETSLEEARAQMEVTRAQLEKLQTERQLLQDQLKRRVLTASEPGTVTLVLTRDPGEQVKKGQELAKLAADEKFELQLYGGGRNVHRLHPGQRVQFTTETFSPWTEGYCFATVDLISPDSDLAVRAQDSDATAARYFVKAKVEETSAPLRLGATVKAEILLRRASIFKVLFNLE